MSAVVYAVQKFRYNLWGHRFELITDRKAMEWLMTTAKLRSKLARWSLLLAEYDFSITHRGRRALTQQTGHVKRITFRSRSTEFSRTVSKQW